MWKQSKIKSYRNFAYFLSMIFRQLSITIYLYILVKYFKNPPKTQPHITCNIHHICIVTNNKYLCRPPPRSAIASTSIPSFINGTFFFPNSYPISMVYWKLVSKKDDRWQTTFARKNVITLAYKRRKPRVRLRIFKFCHVFHIDLMMRDINKWGDKEEKTGCKECRFT